MKPNKDRLIYILLGLVFIIFLFLRIFSSSQYEMIQRSDEARYLELAKNFPYHTFHNNQFYITHPPFYPYLIRVFSLFFQDHIAGLFISLSSAIVTFFVIWNLVVLLTNNKYIALSTLLLFSLSPIYINMSTIILKESFTVMLTLLSVYFFILFLKNGRNIDVILSAIFGALLGISTDLVIPLVPALGVIFFIFGKKGDKLWKASIPILTTIIFYGIWVLLRVYVYTHFEYYPASQDGTIVRTADWNLMNLLSTLHFKEAEVWFEPGISLDPLHYIYPIAYMLNLAVAPWPAGLRLSNIAVLFSIRYLFQLVLYTILSAAALYFLYKTTRSALSKGVKNNSMLSVFALFLVFLIPLLPKFTATRYILLSFIFLFVMVSYGVVEFSKKFGIFKMFKVLLVIVVLTLTFYLPFYYINNSHFIFSKIKVVEASNTAKFLNSLPKDGIMTQIGYTQEIDYQTGKRVVALPASTGYISYIYLFDINYVLYGEFYRRPFIEGNSTGFFNYDVVKYVREHPNEFKLLKVIEEYYPTIERKDHIYVYEVIKNK